jgi:hypothetical protein
LPRLVVAVRLAPPVLPVLPVLDQVRVLRVSSLYRSLASPLDCSRGGRADCS